MYWINDLIFLKCFCILHVCLVVSYIWYWFIKSKNFQATGPQNAIFHIFHIIWTIWYVPISHFFESDSKQPKEILCTPKCPNLNSLPSKIDSRKGRVLGMGQNFRDFEPWYGLSLIRCGHANGPWKWFVLSHTG